MAFRKKAVKILKHRPDILIIPECEHPDKLKFPLHVPQPSDVLWFGANKNKGLGIFSYSDYKLKLLDEYNPKFKLVVPLCIYSDSARLTLYAIWANNPDDRDGRYITQIWKAINHYDCLLSDGSVILAGDFNSNTIWDRPRREGNHSTVVTFLEEKGIRSAYHYHFKQEHGKEQHPTLYMYRQKEKSYHIDYCFVSGNLLAKLQSVKIGNFSTWKKLSDHVPVIVDIDLM